MSTSLVIRPVSSDIANVDAIRQWQWLTLDRKGQPIGQPATGGQPPANDSALLLIPANWLHAQRLQLPSMSRAQLHQAIPFAMEEQVAGDIEQLHVAHGSIAVDGSVIAAAIEPDILNSLLQQLRQFNIVVAKAVPDACVIGSADGELKVVAIEQDYVIASGNDFMLLDKDELDFLLSQQPAETQLTWHGRHQPEIEWSGSLQTSLNNAPFVQLAAMAGNTAINIMQGEYLPAARGSTKRVWQLAAGLAGILLLLGFIYAITDWWLLSREVDKYRLQVETTFRETFPEITSVVNPRVQAERALGEINPAQGDALLNLLGGTATVIATQQGLILQTVNYDRSGLRLEVVADSVAKLDELTIALEQQGLTAQLDSAIRSAENVRGQILIGGGDNG